MPNQFEQIGNGFAIIENQDKIQITWSQGSYGEKDFMKNMMNELKYPSKETIDKLTRNLNLKGADEFTQDWEYEVADVSQLSDYVDYYEKNDLNLNEKATLMRMILESYNDFLIVEKGEDIFRERIKKILKKDTSIHNDTLEYWLCNDEETDGCFAITPFIKEIGFGWQ